MAEAHDVPRFGRLRSRSSAAQRATFVAAGGVITHGSDAEALEMHGNLDAGSITDGFVEVSRSEAFAR
jgi:hypothetical protein